MGNFKMIAKRNGKCAVTGERIVAGVTEIEKVNGGWQVAGVPTLRERQEADRQERTAKGLLEKVWPNGWRVWASAIGSSSNRHPRDHSDLGCVVLCPDGRYGTVMSIFYTGDRVAVGRCLDFDIWESEVYAQDDVTVIGLVAIPNGKGGYDTRHL
jgi:hypothetical protein